MCWVWIPNERTSASIAALTEFYPEFTSPRVYSWLQGEVVKLAVDKPRFDVVEATQGLSRHVCGLKSRHRLSITFE